MTKRTQISPGNPTTTTYFFYKASLILQTKRRLSKVLTAIKELFMDINHLHIAVADVSKSMQFYSECFEFKEKEQHGEMLFSENAEGFMLALDPRYPPESLPAWFHFGLSLESPQQVKEIYKKVLSFNLPMPKPLEEYEDFVFFHCKDVDGYTIEVYWEA